MATSKRELWLIGRAGKTCPDCGGYGTVTPRRSDGRGGYFYDHSKPVHERESCPTCEGTGEVPDEPDDSFFDDYED